MKRLLQKLKTYIRRKADRYSKKCFIEQLPANAKLLDIGCGNNSPYHTKLLRHDLFYIGLDITDYNQEVNPHSHSDRYIVVPAEKFISEIDKFNNSVDAIISSHNIEHCDNQTQMLQSMAGALKIGGTIFISFPCEKSWTFPSRKGTLNFFDDPTHKHIPSFDNIVSILKENNIALNVSIKRHRPIYHFIRGLIKEPLSIWRKQVMGGTWALYGFESIIWGRRIK